MSGSRWLLAAITVLCAANITSCCCFFGSTDDDLVLPDPTFPPVADVQVTARITSDATGTAPFAVTLDASGSTDSDGIIVRYDWDFDNDGTIDLADGGVSVPFDYDPAGNYVARVVVTDDDGLSDDDTTNITVNPVLVPPTAVASATAQATGSTVADLDGSASTDSDGTIESYDWDFENDGTYDLLDGGATPVHDFGAFGTFTIGLRVTDNDGLTDTATTTVTLTDLPNVPPVAILASQPDGGTADPDLAVVWDASASTDSDGTIVSYDWDMDNDGTFEITNGGPTQNASYNTTGLHVVGVRVTDDDGATDATTEDVDVNLPPVALLVPTPQTGNKPLSVTWDASGSSDPDGTITSIDWDMDNDGIYEILNGGTSQVANYPDIGNYIVAIRVVDNDLAFAEANTDVDVNGTPPVAALVGTPEQGGFVPNNVTWDASGSTDADGTVVTYDWDLDDDGIFETLNGGPQQVVPYNTSGNKVVNVRVTDDDGMTDEATDDVDLFDVPA